MQENHDRPGGLRRGHTARRAYGRGAHARRFTGEGRSAQRARRQQACGQQRCRPLDSVYTIPTRSRQFSSSARYWGSVAPHRRIMESPTK